MTRLTNHSRWNLFVCITLSLLVAQQVQDARAVEPAAPPDPEALISAALGRPITFAFEETPLDDVVKFFGEKFGISVALDTKALDEVGIGLDTPVTIRLTGISAASAIRHMLRQIDPTLTHSVRDGALTITTREAEEQNLETRFYDVADLTNEAINADVIVQVSQHVDPFPTDGDTDTLIELLTTTVQPESWDEVGGPGSITIRDGILAVSQVRSIEEEVAGTLSALRRVLAKSDSQRDDVAPIDVNPSAGKDIAKEFAKLLDGTGPQLTFKETPLGDVVEALGSATKKTVLLDQKALDEVGIGADTPVTFQLKGLTLRQEIKWILRQIDPTLTYCMVDEALLITTCEAAEENLQTLIYPVWDLVDDDPLVDFDSLIELITRTVEPISWDEVGGPGSVAEFEQCVCLVVSQTQQVHEKLQDLLARLREIEKNRKATSRAAVDADPYVVALYQLRSSVNHPAIQSGSGGGGGGFFSAPAEQPDAHAAPEPVEESEKLNVADEVIPLIQQLIEPASWSADEVVIRPLGKNLVVRQRVSIQRRIVNLLQSLELLDMPGIGF